MSILSTRVRHLIVLLVVCGLAVMTVAGTGTNPRQVNIDGFEDGDEDTLPDSSWTGWDPNGFGNDFSTQTNVVYDGQYSARLSTGSTQDMTVVRNREGQIRRVTSYIRIDQQTGNNDNVTLQLLNDSNKLASVNFRQDGSIRTESGRFVDSWNTGQWYNVTIADVSYSPVTYDIVIDGVVEEQVATNKNDFVADTITIENQGGSNGQSVELYVDNVATEATLDSAPPSFDNSSASPKGGLSNPPGSISINVSDGDLPNDVVDVTAYHDGASIGTKTVYDNSSLSFAVSPNAGNHSYRFEAVDDQGNTANSETFSYQVPDTLSIRNETNYTDLVPAEGSVTFFGDNTIHQRSAPNGTVNMSGLPVGEDFVVQVDATDQSMTSRTVYIESIYEQQSVYLLNKSAYTTVENRFVLDDPTGKYDSRTVLKVQKSINTTNGYQYQTIVSDEFGVEGVTARLEDGQRYRLVVSANGEEQVVGPYRSDVSETVSVEPGSPVILSESGSAAYSDGWFKNATLQNDTLEYAYSDLRGETDKLVINIHKRGEPSTLLTANQTYIDIGNASGVVKLAANQTDDEWVVNYVVSRNGETYVLTDIVGNQKNLTPPVDSGWQLVMGISMLILFGGAFSILNARIGAVVVSLVGGVLWYIGFLGAATTGIAVVSAIFLSVLGYYLRS